MHKLDLIIPHNKNCKTLVVQDASIYDSNFPVTNIILEIKPPGQSCFIPFTLLAGWCSKTFNCVDFNLCCIGDDVSVLPDGIWEIKYSIDPNVSTMIEANHMRVCQLMSTYIKTIGVFLSNKCNYNKKEIESIEKELLNIKNLIDNSIFAAEDLLDNSSAIELYNEASLRLNKFNNGNFSSCCR
jgi:hypothetical protein